MVDFISTLGLSMAAANNLTTGQTTLAKLSEQLTTGRYSDNLSDYSSSAAQKLMNFNSQITQEKGFLSVISAIAPRMDVYDSSLNGIETVASTVYSSILSNSTYNPDQNTSLQSSITGAMEQIEYYLNQKVGDRYIFSGSRYGQAPVGDITALPSPPTETAPYLATGNEVPAYDTDYDSLNPTAAVPSANTNEQVSIDVTQKLTYGINSNEDGFQQIIMGLRFAYAATNDQANYTTYMASARDLISQGLSNVRATHTDSTNAYATLNKTKEMINSNITNLTNQVSDIENVDVNEVAVKITTLEAQLEAAYASTSKLVNLSIIDYL